MTHLLGAVGAGDAAARSRLWNLVYNELKVMARHKLAKERPGHSLQATALVHEVFLRLTAGDQLNFENRRHFFGAAAQAMLRVLIEHGRKRRLPFADTPWDASERLFGADPSVGLTRDGARRLDEALQELQRTDPRKAEIVMLRYFVGLTSQETAQLLGVCRRTVQIEWRFAKAWLHRKLSG